jgi:hypothetical protein
MLSQPLTVTDGFARVAGRRLGWRHGLLNFIERRNSAGALEPGRLCELRKHICARLKISQRLLENLSSPLRFLRQVVSAIFLPAFKTNWAHTPAMRFAILTTTLAFLFSGCVSAHKKGRTIHERFDYQIVQPSTGEPVALLKCHEIWLDEFKGGGVALLTDPSVSAFASFHTNQTALGGGSTFTIGSGQSVVSSNGIIASGEAINQIIQGIGAAVGQAANKSVTGTPLKP